MMIPRSSEKTDWQVELGVVIGREAKYAEDLDVLSYFAGYCVVNDLSERAFQPKRKEYRSECRPDFVARGSEMSAAVMEFRAGTQMADHSRSDGSP